MAKRSRAERAIHVLLIFLSLGSIVGCYFLFGIINQLIVDNSHYHWTLCISKNLQCNNENSCVLSAQFTLPYMNDSSVVSFNITDFSDYTYAAVTYFFSTGSNFDCIFNDRNYTNVLLVAPQLGKSVIFGEYFLSIVVSIIFGYLGKLIIYLVYGKRFVAQESWKEYSDSLWDVTEKQKARFPIATFLNIDLVFLLIIFATISFSDDNSLVYVFLCVPIITFSTLLSLQHQKDPNFWTNSTAKIHAMIANLSLTNGWCTAMILAGISLCVADPFPDIALNVTCIVVFFFYGALKGYFLYQAVNLLRAFYSNNPAEKISLKTQE